MQQKQKQKENTSFVFAFVHLSHLITGDKNKNMFSFVMTKLKQTIQHPTGTCATQHHPSLFCDNMID
jgi:hypothetical protein